MLINLVLNGYSKYIYTLILEKLFLRHVFIQTQASG